MNSLDNFNWVWLGPAEKGIIKEKRDGFLSDGFKCVRGRGREEKSFICEFHSFEKAQAELLQIMKSLQMNEKEKNASRHEF